MLTLVWQDPNNEAGLSFGVLGVLMNVINCGNFGSNRSRGFRAACEGSILRIAIGFWVRPYNSASITVQHVIKSDITSFLLLNAAAGNAKYAGKKVTSSAIVA